MNQIQKHYTKTGATCRMMLSLAPELKQAIAEEATRQKKTQTLLVNELLRSAFKEGLRSREVRA